jgi:hypothetical protein
MDMMATTTSTEDKDVLSSKGMMLPSNHMFHFVLAQKDGHWRYV